MNSSVAERLDALFAELQQHDALYHGADDPKISDADYDNLRDAFNVLLLENPEFKPLYHLRDTPGAAASVEFAEVQHQMPMLSLEKVKTAAELSAFIARTQAFLNVSALEFFADCKADGLSVSLWYAQGRLVRAATRGNGQVGEDITHTIRTIVTIPHFLSDVPAAFEVRGEVYMRKDDFYRLNAAQEAAGKKVFANPRNAAAGSVRQLDSAISALRPLRFMAFGLGVGAEGFAPTMQELYRRFDDWKMPHSDCAKLCSTEAALQDYWQELALSRAQLAFDIDGVVFKVNSLADQQRLGVLTRTPRWAVAGKFDPDSGISQIENIALQVGRTGVVTPVAHLTPVNVGGVLISRASLHNRDEIARKDVRLQDTVRLVRAGDVIPKVEEVLKDQRPEDSVVFEYPQNCPSCNRVLLFSADEVAVRCNGGWDCSAQAIGRLKYFVSRAAMDIEGLGVKLIERLHQEGLLQRPSDIYLLENHAIQIQAWDGFGAKSWQNLLQAIERSRDLRLSRFLLSLGIPQIGQASALLISTHYTTLKALQVDVRNDKDEVIARLTEINGIGVSMAEDFLNIFRDPSHAEEIAALVGHLNIVPDPVAQQGEGFLSGKTVVFTGKFMDFSRAEAQEKARMLGAKVASSVSSKTDIVIVGTDAGSKRSKAEKLAIEIWSEIEWLDRLKAEKAEKE